MISFHKLKIFAYERLQRRILSELGGSEGIRFLFVKIKLSEKMEKVGNAHKTEAGKTFSLLHKYRIH